MVWLATMLCGGAACSPPLEDGEEVVEVAVSDEKSDSTSTVSVKAGLSVSVQFTATGGPLDVSVDCKPPTDPDTVGTQFTVTSAALGMATASPARAGYWQWSGDVSAGSKTIKLKGKSGTSSCTVHVRVISGSCTDSTSFHSPSTGHTHLAVGTAVSTWGSFPVSGDHWGAWAAWDTVYAKPVKRGFLLHNLEHGGVVLSYKCSSATASAACGQAEADLVALKNTFGDARVIVTPDPLQPTRYAARAWRWRHQSTCFDQDRMLDFVQAHHWHGREDEDGNPPVPYDPTTLQVPCEDLMAAPDS